MRNTIIAILIVLAAAVPAEAQTQTDPYTIFAQARHTWMMQRYPRSMAYTIEIRGMEKGQQKVRHYTVNYDSYSGKAYPNAVSVEQQEHPFVPHGTNINLNMGPIPIPLNAEHADQDPFGIPELAPNYSFGIAPNLAGHKVSDRDLIAQIRAQYPSKQPAVLPTGLPEIGVVTAVHQDYAMQFVGIESINGTIAYHLGLRPLRQPKRFRLRDVWIDAKSYAVERLKSDGNFEYGAPVRTSWMVDFRSVDGLEFISTERALSAQRFSDDPFRITGHMVNEETLTFQDMALSERGFPGFRLVDPDLEILREPE